MAELHVQPKKKSNWLIWLLLAAIIIALLAYYFMSRNSDVATRDTSADSTASTAVTTTPGTASAGSEIDFNSPTASYEEITDKDINVRASGNYAIYSLGENILFDVDKSTIRSDAEPRLKEIAGSLAKRYGSADIIIYGNTDSTGDATHNRVLSVERAREVKNWLVKNAKLADSKIALQPEGETNPQASNATEEGKQLNRNVQIVAKNP